MGFVLHQDFQLKNVQQVSAVVLLPQPGFSVDAKASEGGKRCEGLALDPALQVREHAGEQLRRSLLSHGLAIRWNSTASQSLLEPYLPIGHPKIEPLQAQQFQRHWHWRCVWRSSWLRAC